MEAVLDRIYQKLNNNDTLRRGSEFKHEEISDDTIPNSNNEEPRANRSSSKDQETENTKEKEIKQEMSEVNSPSPIEIMNFFKSLSTNQSSLLPILNLQTSNHEHLMETSNNQVEEEDEWLEAYRKLDKGSCKEDRKEVERRRQMAKNREYARKCVQKKKDMRKQAEIRKNQYLNEITRIREQNERKERNANFAVDLRKMMGEESVDDEKERYEMRKEAVKKEFEQLSAEDETVNINYHRWISAKEEFEKAAEDLKLKKGVIGTLGSRKIRAKQQMEWRLHLYEISMREHDRSLQMSLSLLVDEYVRSTVPKSAPLVSSIPKNLLDELIKDNLTSKLEEFCRFVTDNNELIVESKESVVK